MKYIQLKDTDPSTIELLKNYTGETSANNAVFDFVRQAGYFINCEKENLKMKEDRKTIKRIISNIADSWHNLQQFEP